MEKRHHETFAKEAIASNDLLHSHHDLDPVVLNPFQAYHRDDEDAASIGEDNHDQMILVQVPDKHGNMVQYPRADDELSKTESIAGDFTTGEPSEEAPRTIILAGVESVKYMFSFALLVFSVVVVMSTIFKKQTIGTAEMGIPSSAAFFLFWFLILWLAMMEGGQGCLVGLQPVPKSMYAESHPKTSMITSLIHSGGNMERFIVGRQFLAVLVVFVTNLVGSATADAEVFGLSDIMKEIFLNSGVALILVTIMLGQLTAQVNAANCMLDFINNYFMLFTAYVSLGIEYSGLLHVVYLLQIVFSKLTGKSIDMEESSQSLLQRLFFWARMLMSLAILVFAFAVTLTALFDGNTTMWDGVPPLVSVIILFLLMAFVGILEGMQIALFTVVNLPEEELRQHTTAFTNCQMVFRDQNLQGFLMGRQICVTCCMFVVARITTLSVEVGENNIFGVSDGLQEFFNTGLLGAIITTLVASLVWRIIASSFPVAFLSNPIISICIRLCLLFEASGLCSASWILARWHKPLVNYQPDEVHLEGAAPHTSEPVTRRDMDIDRLVTVFKYSYSVLLLGFAIVLVTAAIFEKKTNGTVDNGIQPWVAFLIFIFLIVWLGMMEGGQGALISLRPINKEKYESSHAKALMNTRKVHEGDNLERYIVGRQFLVVLVVFVTNVMGSTVQNANVLNLPDFVNETFMETGLALVLVTIVIGQLTAQVNAANCMLDFLNGYFMFLTTYVSLGIEFSGILHFVYLVQLLFSMISGKPMKKKEAPRNLLQGTFFWARVVMSMAILGYAFAVTFKALFDGKTTMWEGVPSYISVIILLLIMAFVGMLEGLQIALFAVLKTPKDDIRQSSVAFTNCELAFRDQNLQALLIGRQICVTCCMFVVAKITTIKIEEGEENVFDVSDGFQEFFNTGLLGAVITTVMASLIWRIIAASFPIAFLSNPLIHVTIRLCLLIEASGLCSAAWVLGRWAKLMLGYQPDEVYLSNAERHGKEPITRRDKDIDITVTVIKYIYSMVLLIFSVTVVMGAIFEEKTKLGSEQHPLVAFFVIWFLIVWLAMMEGGQGCLVGLQPVDKELYKESHSVTHLSTSVAHKGDNMARFIVGRQFLVVLVVFVINMSGAALEGSNVLGLPTILNEIFVSSGLAMSLMTIMLGQLTAQVNAANCMLDFIDTYFMVFTTYASLAMEASGLLHSVYLVQILFSRITDTPVETKEPPRSTAQSVLFWGRVVFSVAILGYSFAVTLSALFAGKTAMWEGVPTAVSILAFFFLMCFVGMMEGMQIALFAVVNLPEKELNNYKLAAKICKLTFHGSNLQAFLIGRQICVTICTFVVARITTIVISDGESNIFDVPNGVQEFFNTGLLGAIITTIVASLAWRIVASSFPVVFLSNPIIYLVVRLCLLLEASGVCSAVWLLALVPKAILNYQVDDVHIGSPDERARSAQAQEWDIEQKYTGSEEKSEDD